MKNELVVMSCSVDMFHSDSKGLLSVCGGFVDALDRWRAKIKDLLNNNGSPSSASGTSASPQPFSAPRQQTHQGSIVAPSPQKASSHQQKPAFQKRNIVNRSAGSSPEIPDLAQQQAQSRFQFKSNNVTNPSNGSINGSVSQTSLNSPRL